MGREVFVERLVQLDQQVQKVMMDMSEQMEILDRQVRRVFRDQQDHQEY
jgi:hypothetical protein